MTLPETRPRPTPWLDAALWILGFVLLLWTVEFVDAASGHRLDDDGIVPRESEGLLGIVFAPFLHLGWDHLAANSLPLLVLGFLILVSGVGRWVAVTAIIWVFSGVGTWLTGPPNTVHIGASALVFGWLTYLMTRGFFNRSGGQILIGLVVFFVYGGLLWGALPSDPTVSWQGHLFGAIGGGLAAYLTAPGRFDEPAA